MKITVDTNALFIMGSSAPLFHNNGTASVYVKIDDGTTPVAMGTGNVFTLPYTLVSKTYNVTISKTSDTGFYEVPVGASVFVATNPTNKMVAYVGTNDSVFYKEICNNVNTRCVGDQLTGGLTLVAASLGLVSVVSDVASAKVTVNHMDNSLLLAIAEICGEEAAKRVAELINTGDKFTIRG